MGLGGGSPDETSEALWADRVAGMRLACWQSGLAGIAPTNAAWRRMVARCSDNHIDLLVAPEFAVGGLPHTAAAAKASSVTDSSSLAGLVQGAATSLALVVGFTEQSETGLHSSAALVLNGQTRVVSRKVHPREPGISSGGLSITFDVAGVRCGALLCADARDPALAATLAADGARVLICLLNNDVRHHTADKWLVLTERALADRARENRCWVISADVAGRTSQRRGLGATRIYDPAGDLVSASSDAPETGIVFDLL
ncbi:putative amidohydrolase [Nakamurella sp. UYEF19]|uniref:carbon-nitrogen hydrolase family protein n=1 Tax=Nakamurella sp. UYEF19 TaxID=1756392 RepID=UPI0033913127